MKVIFQDFHGKTLQEAEAEVGETLLNAGQTVGMEMEGACEGNMACATCHVIVLKEWFDQLPIACEDEEDMLDLTNDLCATSRLACQISLTEAMDGLTVRLPRS